MGQIKWPMCGGGVVVVVVLLLLLLWPAGRRSTGRLKVQPFELRNGGADFICVRRLVAARAINFTRPLWPPPSHLGAAK